jgi:hypothetical protein
MRSAILKTSQPRAAKPTPQKRTTETTVFPLSIYMTHTTLSPVAASNKLLMEKPAAKGVSYLDDPSSYRSIQLNAVTPITVR